MSALLAAAGINFASRFLQGIGESNQAKTALQIYANQADIYRQNAARTRLIGAYNEDMMRAQNRAYTAKARAAAGEAGMGESETFATALAHTASGLEQNVLNARYQTESEAMNYLYQAAIADENARQMKKKSRHRFQNALINGIYGAMNIYSGGLNGGYNNG